MLDTLVTALLNLVAVLFMLSGAITGLLGGLFLIFGIQEKEARVGGLLFVGIGSFLFTLGCLGSINF